MNSGVLCIPKTAIWRPGAAAAVPTYGDASIWLAVAPRWRLVLAFVVGKRTQAQADLLLQRVVADDP